MCRENCINIQCFSWRRIRFIERHKGTIVRHHQTNFGVDTWRGNLNISWDMVHSQLKLPKHNELPVHDFTSKIKKHQRVSQIQYTATFTCVQNRPLYCLGVVFWELHGTQQSLTIGRHITDMLVCSVFIFYRNWAHQCLVLVTQEERRLWPRGRHKEYST